MKYLKTYEGSGFGKSYPGHEEPTPKFKIGDEVVVTYNLIKFGHSYGINKGDKVTITDFWINANGDISYNIDSSKLRCLKSGIDIRTDTFDEFYFEYEHILNSKKFGL